MMQELSLFVFRDVHVLPPVSKPTKTWSMYNAQEVCYVQMAYKQGLLTVYEYHGFTVVPYSDIKEK